MKNNFYKPCERCDGQGKLIENTTNNQDPRFDEIVDCDAPKCINGLVPNIEVIKERRDEINDLIGRLEIKKKEYIERVDELIYQLANHQYELKYKL